MTSMYEGIGLEELLDDLEIGLVEGLNDAIPVVNERLEQRDIARAARRNVEYIPVEVEPIGPDHYYVPTIPSFVATEEDRAELYPLIAITPGRFAQAPGSAQQDHYDIISSFVTVHSFAKASPDEGDEMAGRRAMRYAAAIYRVVKTHPSLRRQFSGSAFNAGQISEPFLFPSVDGIGENWYWQSAYTEFQISNHARIP